MREHDCVEMEPLKFSQPIKSAIDHHLLPAIGHQQRAVHMMSPRPRFDLSTGAEEREFHQETIATGSTGANCPTAGGRYC